MVVEMTAVAKAQDERPAPPDVKARPVKRPRSVADIKKRFPKTLAYTPFTSEPENPSD